MSETKICPKCEGSLEKGFIPDKRRHGYQLLEWYGGHPIGDHINVELQDEQEGIPVGAYRCSDCGYLEFYSEEQHMPVSRKAANAAEDVRERYIRKTKAADERLLKEDHSISSMVFLGVITAIIGFFIGGLTLTGASIGAGVGGIIGYRLGLPEKTAEKQDQNSELE